MKAERTDAGWRIAALLVLLAAVIPAVLWPGDTLWTNDEPRLIANAWHANAGWHPAWGGLWGNFGIRYGPFPTQFYQVLLLITHDPLVLATLRAGLCMSASAVSLLWLARSLGFSPWFAGAALVAPWVLYFHRLIWDASFAMPLGALALAAFAAYLRRGHGWCLVLSTACTVIFATVHPQDLPLAAAIGGMILWRHRPALRRNWKPLCFALAAILALNAVFLVQLAHLVVLRLGGAVAAGYPNGTPPQAALFAPFLGGNLLAGQPIADTISARGTAVGPEWWLQLATAIIYPLCWAGIGLAGWRAWRRWRHDPAPVPGESTIPMSSGTARDVIGLVALAAAVMQGLLFAVMRVPPGAQYFFGTFVVHVCLAWIAIEAIPWKSLRFATIAAYGLPGAFLTLHGMWVTHRDGSPIEPLQPTLRSQFELARKLNEHGADTVLTEIPHLRQFGQGVRALRLLLPHSEQKGTARLLVRARKGAGAKRGEFEVIEVGETAVLPKGAVRVDLTPLPEGWYPNPPQ